MRRRSFPRAVTLGQVPGITLPGPLMWASTAVGLSLLWPPSLVIGELHHPTAPREGAA